VGNNRDRFESIEPHHEELLTGDHRTIIEGYGMMHVKLTKANGSTKILRAHAAYIPGFHTNLISTNLTEERIDVCFDQRSGELQKGPERECFAKLKKIHGLFVIEYNPVNLSFATGSNFPSTHLPPQKSNDALNAPEKASRKRSAMPKFSVRTKELWAARYGHPSEDVIRHIPEAVTGVEITNLHAPKPLRGEPKPLDEIRELANAKEKISRRTFVNCTRQFERLFWDMVFISTEGYNGHNILSHFYDPYTHLHLVETIEDKTEAPLNYKYNQTN